MHLLMVLCTSTKQSTAFWLSRRLREAKVIAWRWTWSLALSLCMNPRYSSDLHPASRLHAESCPSSTHLGPEHPKLWHQPISRCHYWTAASTDSDATVDLCARRQTLLCTTCSQNASWVLD